jgi:hypothetical protein
MEIIFNFKGVVNIIEEKDTVHGLLIPDFTSTKSIQLLCLSLFLFPSYLVRSYPSFPPLTPGPFSWFLISLVYIKSRSPAMNGAQNSSTGSNPQSRNSNITLDLLPQELKLLIYNHVDLQTLKTLRQASPSWAQAGLPFLLLPTFNIRSSFDTHRLLSISRSPNLSHLASRIIKHLTFQAHGWDPRYFRNIVCNRHELRQRYEPLDFVPTRAEQAALEELDAVIRQKDVDTKEESDLGVLGEALRAVPGVEGVIVLCENPFTHPILRKSWEEYDLEAYQLGRPQHAQLFRILSAAKDAGLVVCTCVLCQCFHSQCSTIAVLGLYH